MKAVLLVLLTALAAELSQAQEAADYPFVTHLSAGPHHLNANTGMGEFYRAVLTDKGDGEKAETRFYIEYLTYDRDLLDYKIRERFAIPADFLSSGGNIMDSGAVKILEWPAWDEVKIFYWDKRLILKLGRSLYETKKTVIEEGENYASLHGEDGAVYTNIESMSRGPFHWNEITQTGEYYRLFVTVREVYSYLYLEHIIMKGEELLESELKEVFIIPAEKFETAPYKEEGGKIAVTKWLKWNEAVIEYDYGCTKLKLAPRLSEITGIPCE